MSQAVSASQVALIPPSDAQRNAIEGLLEADKSALGDVWRRLRAGETPDQIKEARGNRTNRFVWNYRARLDALLEGKLPASETLRRELAAMFRALPSKMEFSEDLRGLIAHNAELIENSLADDAGEGRIPLGDYLAAIDELRLGGSPEGAQQHKPSLLLHVSS